jgi:cardiolipin synthase (CMP-forming)
MRVFDIGGGDGPERVTDRILTVPNLLSFARLAILPLIYLDLVSGAHLRAFVLLVVFASTDWFDGYIARRFDQVSKLGKLLDPLSDRVLFVVVGIGFAMGELLPWWAILLLLGRDLLVVASGGIVLLRGGIRPDVTRLGKAATFGLLFALPAFLLASVLGDGPLEPQPQVQAIAWASTGRAWRCTGCRDWATRAGCSCPPTCWWPRRRPPNSRRATSATRVRGGVVAVEARGPASDEDESPSVRHPGPLHRAARMDP